MKNSLVQFIVAFVICFMVFVAMDAALMNMQGLSLVFHE